jgi:hypothetical protein
MKVKPIYFTGVVNIKTNKFEGFVSSKYSRDVITKSKNLDRIGAKRIGKIFRGYV